MHLIPLLYEVRRQRRTTDQKHSQLKVAADQRAVRWTQTSYGQSLFHKGMLLQECQYLPLQI